MTNSNDVQFTTLALPPPPSDPCAAEKATITKARELCRAQITAWRSEKPQRSWAWIKKQPTWAAFVELGGS